MYHSQNDQTLEMENNRLGLLGEQEGTANTKSKGTSFEAMGQLYTVTVVVAT